ncbi:MAG: prevent-host-death protein [Verrucomicrobiota bacterium]|nr:prevent-host-death protein [Verrucomicrobiota bacterium]
MKTATVADLRNNFRRVSAWIEHGETVKILKRGRAFAQLTAIPVAETGGTLVKPDIMAQLKEVWGERILSMEEVKAMRDDELADDLG